MNNNCFDKPPVPSPVYPDIKEIRLTPAEYKILKYIRKNGTITTKKGTALSTKFKQDNAAARLWFYGLTENKKDKQYSISARGNLWYEYNKQDQRSRNLHIALTSISITIAFASLIVSILSMLK